MAGLATGATVAALACALAACSPGTDYPSILQSPAPRAEQPMNPEQVQQATQSLMSDRRQLSQDALAAQQSAVASGMATPPATTGTTPSAGAVSRQ